jgi:ribosomal protein S12 methylthiotransferase
VDEIARRVEHITALVDELMTQRAEDRVGENVAVLIEDDDERTGRALHQGPETDGVTRLGTSAPRGTVVTAVVIDTDGVDLVADRTDR